MPRMGDQTVAAAAYDVIGQISKDSTHSICLSNEICDHISGFEEGHIQVWAI